MSTALDHDDGPRPLPLLRTAPPPNVADQVFEVLNQRILTLELPPGTRISEAEVAGMMGVSRQPVREAFKRLAKQGFLHIRPQSGTTVSLISEEAVLQARYVRTALEMETCRTACATIDAEGLDALAKLIERQKEAVAEQDREKLHALDDLFHKELCERSGVGYVWDLIHENKGHMDRIRMLSLNSFSQQLVVNEHMAICEAIARRDPDAAVAAMNQHLSRIHVLIAQIKKENHNWFTDRNQ